LSLSFLKSKIVLGTVQLGLPYGINNAQGKPNEEEAFRILDLAIQNNISLLDTADAYGNATEVIGAYLYRNPSVTVQIINKFIDDNVSLSVKFEKSLRLLSSKFLYAYMYHRFSDYSSGKFANDLNRLKEEEKIKKIGVSIYSLQELEQVITDTTVDLIQLPLSPFDYSHEKQQLVKQAKEAGKEIHVRSVFLQGLLFKTPDQLTGNLKSLYEPLKKFHEIVHGLQLNVRQVCLNYAVHKAEIDHVLIGVDTTTQLRDNMESILPYFDGEIMKKVESIAIPDVSMLNPSNWRP
jgi:aryl-alcohol dehydrogenase-like predicted oxidoreductase